MCIGRYVLFLLLTLQPTVGFSLSMKLLCIFNFELLFNALDFINFPYA